MVIPAPIAILRLEDEIDRKLTALLQLPGLGHLISLTQSECRDPMLVHLRRCYRVDPITRIGSPTQTLLQKINPLGHHLAILLIILRVTCPQKTHQRQSRCAKSIRILALASGHAIPIARILKAHAPRPIVELMPSQIIQRPGHGLLALLVAPILLDQRRAIRLGSTR